MATFTISDSTYRRLNDLAAAMRLPLDQFLARVADEALAARSQNSPSVKPGTPQWTQEFQAWLSSHAAPHAVADDSRDAIYGDERN